jgi:hypothetical protein
VPAPDDAVAGEPTDLHAVRARLRALPDGIVSLTIWTHTSWATALTPATLPLAALWHIPSSLSFSEELSNGASEMLDLHSFTAAAICGERALVVELVDALFAAVVVFVVLEPELEPPPPQPTIAMQAASASVHSTAAGRLEDTALWPRR